MEISTRSNLADLNEDVLFHICSFLDKNTISLLVQVCKSLRDKLYHPRVWRNTVLALFDIDKATADSLKVRNIKSAILMNLSGSESENITPNSISNLMTVDTLDTLVVQQSCAKSLPFPSGTIDLIPGLDNLQCLVIFLDAIDFQMESKRTDATSSDVPQLVISQQVIHRLDQDGNVSQLKDLECKCLYNDWSLGCHPIHNICLDLADPSDRDKLCHLCGDLSSLERLAGVTLSITDISQLEELSKYFPRLKHLEFETNCMDSTHYLGDVKKTGPNILQNIESLVITVSPDVRHTFYSFMTYKPNIKALSLRCSVPAVPDSEYNIYIRQLLAWTKQQNLVVLRISSKQSFGSKYEAGIKQAICELKNLQVLILPKIHFSHGFVTDILKNLGMLKSLIGIIGDDRIDSLPSLLYKTSTIDSDKVLKRLSGSTWVPVREYSDDWCEAHGMEYFYPQESLRNLKLTHSTSIYQAYRRKFQVYRQKFQRSKNGYKQFSII